MPISSSNTYQVVESSHRQVTRSTMVVALLHHIPLMQARVGCVGSTVAVISVRHLRFKVIHGARVTVGRRTIIILIYYYFVVSAFIK